MPQFEPSIQVMAVAPIRVTPAGLSCQAKLFLGPNDATPVASSGLIPFISTGSLQEVDFPIRMPAVPGTYHVYVDVNIEESLLLAYQGMEEVDIAVPFPPAQIVANMVIAKAPHLQIEEAISDYGLLSSSGYHQIADALVASGGPVGEIYRFRYVGPGWLYTGDHGQLEEKLFLSGSCSGAYQVFIWWTTLWYEPDYETQTIAQIATSRYNKWVKDYVLDACPLK